MSEKKWGKIAEASQEEEALEEESTQAYTGETLVDSSPEAIASDAAPVEILQKQVAELSHQLAAAQEKMLRVMADADNVKRRATRDVESAHKYALEKFVRALLPVIDSLERAHAFDEELATPEAKAMLEGLTLTLQLFESVWEKFGMKQLNPVGEPFDPMYHEAVTMQPSVDHPANTVLNVIQKGYLLNERLVRAAMVIVSQ